MARKKKDDVKPKRTRMPRQKRDKPEPSDDGGAWLLRSSALMDAHRIINHYKERPYWLSIKHTEGVEPVAGFFPCSFFRRGSRVYYGFLLRDHREAMVARWPHARRELSSRMQEIRSLTS